MVLPAEAFKAGAALHNACLAMHGWERKILRIERGGSSDISSSNLVAEATL